eukprot:scaffold22075_cov71-Phaeocystis_antarctica.AAC.1
MSVCRAPVGQAHMSVPLVLGCDKGICATNAHLPKVAEAPRMSQRVGVRALDADACCGVAFAEPVLRINHKIFQYHLSISQRHAALRVTETPASRLSMVQVMQAANAPNGSMSDCNTCLLQRAPHIRL